jgi:hypothetical protein
MFPRLREQLADASAAVESRKHAFAVLSRAQDRASLAIFVRLLDDAAFRLPAINLLARFDTTEVSEALLSRLDRFSSNDRSAALNALTGRATFGLALLDAIEAGRLKRNQLTAFHVHQLAELKNADVDRRVTAT